MTRLLISAAHKSSGKTTLATGLCAALAARGLRVQAFKKGPDYIDPLWLGSAAGRPCINLDFHTQDHDEILDMAAHYERDADVSLVEGNKGLYDGVDLEGANSNAALARLLNIPVVLVVDCRGMTRGVAPLLLGYQAFDREIDIAGVIFNRVGGARHESKLRAVTEHYTDIPVLGAVHENAGLQIIERHLGLVPSNEHASADAQIRLLGETIASQVDMERLIAVGADSSLPEPVSPVAPVARESTHPVRIAIARDAAFGFYYHTDLEALEQAGARLMFFDTLSDTQLPEADALFIGGGFPETHLQALEANSAMRESIRQAIEGGMPAYAECGGLMYLSRSIGWKDRSHTMVGVIPGDVMMHERPQGRGYVRLKDNGRGPWPLVAQGDQTTGFPAHEFHYSALGAMAPDTVYAYDVLRGHGVDGRHDGIVIHRLLASYSHLRHTRSNPWASRFVAYVRNHLQSKSTDAIRSTAP